MASQSARHAATVRKVQHMLDVTVDDTLRDLFVYVDDVVPGLVASSASSSSSSSSSSTAAAACVQSEGERAAALRTALDRRAVQMHSEFVDSFGGLCAAYEDAATHIRALHELCAQLQRTLQARASDMDALCGSAAALQQTLQQTQQHERDMREFATKYSFGDAEQRTLADGDVDVDYLDVLERVCLVHRQSRALLLSRTHAASASAVMEATYTALVQATERVLRYVLAEAVVAKKPQTHYDATTQRGGSSSSSGGGSSGGSGHGCRGGAGGAVSLSADVPEVTSFYVRCMCVLREHTPQQWRRALDEVARLRRQSVLRRYYHLLTTGSATTTAGTYHVQHARGVTSSSRTGSISGSEHASDAYALSLSSSRIHDEQQQQQSHGMGTRPLEAALHDPVYFYSSLFAWLHQTMVEEDELFAMFLAHDTPHARTPAQDDGGGGDKGGEAHVVLTLYGEDADATATMAENNDDNGSTKQTKQTQGTASSVAALRESLLDVTFAGVCPHMLTALEGVLERLSHSTHHIAHDAVTAATATRAATANNSSSSNNNNSDVTAVGDASRHDGNDASSTAHTPRYTPLGPRGLTGGLTRLLSAARRRALGARAASSAAAADDDVVDTDDATATMTSSNSSSEHGSGGGGVTAAAVHADSDAPLPAALQRYTHVTTRAQQESLAAAAMHKGVRALLVAATLQQLCAYYVASTLLPLLGARAALTTLVAHTARSHLQHLFDTHAASLSLCVFDSVAGVVHRTTLLRRLAAVHETTTTAAATAVAIDSSAVRDDSRSSNNNNNNAKMRRCFVADFVFAHVTDDSVNNATTTAATTTTAASSMTMSSSTMTTTMTTSAPHASSLTQQQQRTSAHLLLRTLLPLVLPLSPEAHTLLRTLDTVLSEAAERADMLEALQAKHAARTAATTTTTHDDSSSVVRDTATPLFVLLARRLCDAPHALLPSHSAPSSSSRRQQQQQQQRQGRVLYAQRQTLLLRRALDDVCLRIMQLNMWCALAAVLSRHEAYIRRVTATSSSAATTTTTTTTRREQQADDKDSSNNNEDAECDEDMAARVQHCIDVTVAALIDDVCASAEAHYFAPVTPPLLLLSSSTTRTTTHKALLLHKRVRTRLRQLQSVYTLVASLGKLPPLQLLGAIADATVRERVHAAVTRHVLAVYARVYDEVLTHNSNNNDDDATVTAEHASTLQHDGDSDSATAQLTDDERATLADMAPDKLQLLMDA